MEILGHELLLLMLNLSRMRDREQIVRLFVEALGAARADVTVRLLAAGEPARGDVLEIATPEASFARVALEAHGEPLPEKVVAAYRNAARMLAVVLENIARAERLATENARLDVAVSERTRALREALARSEDLYEHAPCGYHTLDPAGHCVQVNDTELTWLGCTRADLVGPPRFAERVAPESRAAFERALAELAEGGDARGLELELVRKDGSRVPVLMSATAVRDAAGRFTGSRATSYDLSERRAAERALRETEERLRRSQKLEALGRLAGGVAHDFNNLLTVMLACARTLCDELPEVEPLRAEALEIAEAGRRAAQLTRQLLSFGRRGASKPVRLDAGEVVSEMEKMLRRLVGEDATLEVVRAPGLWPVLADPGQLEQVVLNLVVNARDAVGPGGHVRVETSNAEVVEGEGPHTELAPGRHVRLAVSDDGTGMPPEVQARLFEPFFTTKAEGKGTGLGLATLYGIVRQAHGEVRLESAPGKGSRFEVWLPAAGDGAAARAEAGAGEAAEPGREVILLAEDEDRVRAVTAVALRRAGYTVLEAPDGEAALAVAAAAPRVDVLVSDVVMPRMGGLTLAARLRRERPAIGVVLVTGYAEQRPDPDPAHGLTVLDKPYTAAALTHAIREELRAQRARG